MYSMASFVFSYRTAFRVDDFPIPPCCMPTLECESIFLLLYAHSARSQQGPSE